MLAESAPSPSATGELTFFHCTANCTGPRATLGLTISCGPSVWATPFDMPRLATLTSMPGSKGGRSSIGSIEEGGEIVEQRGDAGRGWDSDDPCHHHILRHAPPHRRGAACNSGADDATGDGVGGGDGNTQQRRGEDHDRPAERGGEALVLR